MLEQDDQEKADLVSSRTVLARKIIAQSWRRSFSDGKRIVEVLLAGRDIAELSPEELALLAQGYNWWGKHTEAFAVAKLNFAHTPNSLTHQWGMMRMYAYNAFGRDLHGFIAVCDACIAEQLGSMAFWSFLKAEHYLTYATGEFELQDYEWVMGDAILHPELLPLAAEALQVALTEQADLPEQVIAQGLINDWNERFAALIQFPQFKHLAR